MLLLGLIIALSALFRSAQPDGISDITFQRVEQTVGFDIMKSDLRITKLNRTCAVLNGTMNVFVDMDDRFTFQIKSAHSRLGNNQFNEYPMKIPEQQFCQFLNDTYREYQEIFEQTTNLPRIESDVPCPLPAEGYWFKHFVLKPETMPQMIPEGYWRLTALFTGPEGEADLQIFFTVSKEEN
ncbi:uncharacterized protein LOC135700045 [Ochlerotatus camptorhynchus]|uniref:uncharacterized protein LOC135700045 n=1 Tax=Ochlerotatus camptorhynchus TaxID=644619 RepID=UPI0031D1791B